MAFGTGAALQFIYTRCHRMAQLILLNGIGADLKCKFILLTDNIALTCVQKSTLVVLKRTMRSRIFIFFTQIRKTHLLRAVG